MSKRITKIVLTGGPAAGKTTLISRILHEFKQEDGWRVITIPETATELISGFGIRPFGDCMSMLAFQDFVVADQIHKEKLALDAARVVNEDNILIIYDRALMDDKAYISDEEFAEVLSRFDGRTEASVLAGYDAVIFTGRSEKPVTVNILHDDVVFVDASGLWGMTTTETQERLPKRTGKLVIGLFSDKKPFGYIDEYGEYQGYDVYLARRLAEDLGVELVPVSLDAPNRIEFLQSFKVDIVLANFTYTEDRATQVDFALPYMKVALGVVSPDSALITDAEQLNGKTLIVSKGTTAETFFEQNYPQVKLAKYDSYTEAYIALLDGRGDALSTDNTEVLAWAIENPGFTVGIESLGSLDTINPAVSQGNETLLAWINEEIVKLGEENFFHADYEATLRETYGENADADSLVVEGGVI